MQRKDWFSISVLPPLEGEHYGAWIESVDVLAIDGRGCYRVVKAQYWFEEKEVNWRICGPDSYNFEPTHWTYLPKKP